MRLPFTKKMLKDWAGPRMYHDGQILFEEGKVQNLTYEHPLVRGHLEYGQKSIKCQFKILKDGSADNLCPCRDNKERGLICAHVIAMGMALIHRHTDPDRENKAREEMRRAARLAEVDESNYLKRVPPGTPGATPAQLKIYLGRDWTSAYREGRLPVHSRLVINGTDIPLEEIPTDLSLSLNQQDENILFVLEDISEGPARGQLDLIPSDLINLLNLHVGKPLYIEDESEPVVINTTKMSTALRIHLDEQSGELILFAHTELPFMDDNAFPLYVIGGKSGWIYDAHQFWPLETLLPAPMHGIYEQPIRVARENILRFFETELALIEQHVRVDSDITPDLITTEPGEPRFRLHVRGSPASLAATLYADYGSISLVAGRDDAAGLFSLPDPDDLLRFTVRNPDREEEALAILSEAGFSCERGDQLNSIIGTREVMNFFGGEMPRLQRMGWRMDLEGRVEPFMEEADFAVPVVKVKESGSPGMFDVGFEFENTEGQSLSHAEIQRALLKGESYIERNGRTVFLDADAINTARDVFADCSSGDGAEAGSFRMDGIYSAYVKSSLDALDGIDVECDPGWLRTAEEHNRVAEAEPAQLSPRMDGILRPYQKEGVNWLRFLEVNRFGGILADEMGLGKTLQTLTWLEMEKTHEKARGKPSLIVCPTSLIENWAEEAAKFVPEMQVIILSGSDRHKQWEHVEEADLVITSYALIRRDIDRHLAFNYATIVLDEA
ncbi:MAG: SNF2-related protein, partial [Verrucomicrobiota bacterium]